MKRRKPPIRRAVVILLVALFFGLLPWSAWGQGSTGQEGPQIHLQSGSFDPLEAAAAELNALPGSEPEEFLLQFTGPVKEEWIRAVEEAGAILYDYIPDFAFIARLDDETAREVRKLPFVRWAGPYLPAYRLSPGVSGADSRAGVQPSGANLTLSVQTLPDANVRELAIEIQGLGGTVINSTTTSLAGYLLVTIEEGQVSKIAALPELVWIEPYYPPELANNTGGEVIMNVGEARSRLNLFGKGQIIAIADTGLDTGVLSTLHPDLEGRLMKAYCLGRPGPPCDWGDPHGHGTHVAGSAVGTGASSRDPEETYPYQGSFAGTAPEARLIMQSVLDQHGSLGGIPYDNGMLMREAYEDGARIHSNSWGGGALGVYSVNSQQVDAAAWELKDMLILFAAGNRGEDKAPRDGVVDADSLLSPGTAKNALTIGATESLRTSGGYSQQTWAYFGFTTPPLSSDFVSNNPEGMAAFSSRGPTDDGRVKPDLVAPGTNIISLRSGHSEMLDTGWGIFDDHYLYMGGTSMSTPLTAGAAALVREWLSQSLPNPSAALLKAMLINGAVDISPGQYQNQAEIPSGRPNFVSGWGRVDLYDSLQPEGRSLWWKDQAKGLVTGEEARFTLTLGNTGAVGESSRPLRITLAWNDYPGSLTASKTLVNDLDLELVAPDGKRYSGNSGLYTSGQCLRDAKWDACNNVEGLILNDAPYGTYELIVRGYNIPRGPQPFALVASGEQLRETSAAVYRIFFLVFFK